MKTTVFQRKTPGPKTRKREGDIFYKPQEPISIQEIAHGRKPSKYGYSETSLATDKDTYDALLASPVKGPTSVANYQLGPKELDNSAQPYGDEQALAPPPIDHNQECTDHRSI